MPKAKEIPAPRTKKANRIQKFNAFDAVLLILLTLLGLMIVYPFYNTILVSLVPQADYTRNPFMLWPERITWESYQFVFDSPLLLNSMGNSVKLALVGTVYNMILTVLMAYAFTKPIPGRNFFRFYMVFTMYFGGGLVPFYLLIKALGLIDSFWVMVLPSGISVTYMLIISSNMSALPKELEESAQLDGATDIKILFSIILPLTLPILATFSLYYMVERWNEWYNAMLFVKSVSKWPLQNVLRTIINDVNMMATQNIPGQAKPDIQGDAIKMSSIIVAMAPIMCLYPFLQRYFLSGLTLGAVKE